MVGGSCRLLSRALFLTVSQFLGLAPQLYAAVRFADSEVYGAASVAHKPTFFDLTLMQLVVPFVTVTVYVPGLFTVTVSVLPPETIPPDGPLHENVGLAPPPADTTATNCSCVPPPGALQATSAIVITGF